MREREVPSTTASIAMAKATEGRKESSMSMSRSLRVELKGMGVRLVWLLQQQSACWLLGKCAGFPVMRVLTIRE